MRYSPQSHALLILALSTSVCAAQNLPASCNGQIINDSVGPVCVPKSAKRIVTIEWTYTQNLLALGVQPIAIAQIKDFKEWVVTPIALSDKVVDIGIRGQVNLEQIAALKPDLIIDGSDNNQRAQLTKIAPTLTFNSDLKLGKQIYQEMRNTLILMGQATGRNAQAKQVLARLDSAIVEGRKSLLSNGHSGETFTLSHGFNLNNPIIRVFGSNSWGGEVISQLGLRNTWSQNTGRYGFQQISLEGLTTLKTQNFLFISQSDDDVFAGASAQPVWSRVDFVRQKRAFRLPGNSWLFGGPYGAEQLIRQTVKALTSKSN